MKLKQLRTSVLPLKLKSDGEIPTRKKDLQEVYDAWKWRKPPTFYSAIVREEEDATSGGLDREGMIENAAIDNNNNDGTHTVGNDIIEAMLEIGAVMEV